MITPTAQAPAARADNLSKTYGDGPTRVTALDQVSLEIGARSFTAIMGPSGSGKSTLMHCMAGLDSADGGPGHRPAVLSSASTPGSRRPPRRSQDGGGCPARPAS